MQTQSYGSWVVAVDVAGRVAREKFVPINTAAAVLIPAPAVAEVGSEVKAAFPDSKPKGTEGGVVRLPQILRIIENHDLPVVVLHLTGTNGDVWKRFWNDGESLFSKLSQQTKGARFTKSEPVIRMLLCSLTFRYIVMHALRCLGYVKPTASQPLASIDLRIVHDSDIQNPDVAAVISGGLTKWAREFAPRSLRLRPHVHIGFEREEAEPLILLTDYIAGAFYATQPEQSGLERAFPVGETKALLAGFQQNLGSRLTEDRTPFSQVYPMALQNGALTRRRPEDKP